jgi:hypothetical protein
MVVVPPDAELWATGYVRTFLQGRDEPYATDVTVGKVKPTTNVPRMVTIRRDGGLVDGVVDNPRLTIRVWADKDQEASDLARLLVAAIKACPGNGPALAVTNVFGPSPIPDSSQPQYLVNAELRLRCTPLEI